MEEVKQVAALSGIRVLDLTRVLAGPFCTMQLGDLGADVIKVESVDGGDDTRRWGPPYIGTESAYYLTANRNKRSVALDLKTEQGRELLGQLMKTADVVLHNFLPESAARLGVSYEQVRALVPNIVYCAISGYGASENRPGYDYIMQAEGGLMSITGAEDGEPMKVGVAVTDLFTGLYAAVAILAALRHRDQNGDGQAIDMALYDAQLAMLANVASNVLATGREAQRFGNGHPNIVPYQRFDCQDGQVVVTVGNDRQFLDFCHALDLGHLSADARFASNADRVRNRQVLVPLLEEALRRLPTEDILEKLNLARVPCGPVQSVKEALEAADTDNREMIWNSEHPVLGEINLVGSPLKLLLTPPELYRHPPLHGEHTREIMAELDYNSTTIEEWLAKGAVK
ncbi:MAG: CoA-transferase [Alicyclobacillus sp. RIFOXYA1_FULL_53_8]|nr:MAG: CoA-transferase [Alicyclobacillus sp. RIFOXYA1_FULL_53_8]